MNRSVRVAHALVRAASAFLTALARRPQPGRVLPSRPVPSRAIPSRDRQGAVLPGIENRCPVCQARFRGAQICSRCGADLEPLMLLTVKAWQLRQTARQALDAGDFERAMTLATEAQGAQGSGSGEALRLLCAWLSVARLA